MEIRVDRKVALVTGAAQGIGRAIADTLAASGAAFVADITPFERLKMPALAARADFRAGLARALALLLSPDPLRAVTIEDCP